jgi:dCMP deaminase
MRKDTMVKSGTINDNRPLKDEYYLEIAKAVSRRSTCLRRKFGAIIVKNDAVVSSGYNGTARGVINCLEIGCLKNEVEAPHYSAYDFCPAVHAEENAIINAARHGTSILGGKIFIYSELPNGDISEAKPCDRCKRALINSGIVTVVIGGSDGFFKKEKISDWKRDDSLNYLRKFQEAKKKSVHKK